ncbi:MAG: DUF3352 domain-containing protein [Thermoleophilia bacterium]|nr:DUF3352 domain-containing protein [Thermoleophilia bacterium]
MKRGAVLRAAAVLAAFLATGCGSAKSGAGKAATSADGLEFVPKTAIGYVTVDTDFSDGNWDRARKLGKKFPEYEAQRDKLMTQLNKGGDNKMTFKDDVKPWLGKDAGAALVISGGAKSKGHGIIWVASTNDAKAVKALKKGGAKSAETYKGIKTYSAKDGSYSAIDNGYVVLGDDEATLKLALNTKKDGPSIGDDDTASKAAKHVGDDSIVALVVGRAGVQSALKTAGKSGQNAMIAKALKQLNVNDFNGLALGISPKDRGVALDGWVGSGGKTQLPDDATPTLLTDLPATTAVALTGQDLGGGLEQVLTAVGDSDPKVSSQITQAEAALGLEKGSLGKAFGGKFSISVSGSTKPVVALVVENQGSDTKDTLDKLVGVSQLVGAAPTNLTVKGGSGKQVTFGSITIAEGTLNDVSIITNDPAWLNAWGTGATLGDSDSYKRVTDEAGVPDKVGALLYVDPQATATLGESLSKTGLASSLTGKLGSAVSGATRTTMPGAGADGMGDHEMGAMGATPSAADKTVMAKEALTYLGPILFWTQRDGDNLEFHGFSEITDGK